MRPKKAEGVESLKIARPLFGKKLKQGMFSNKETKIIFWNEKIKIKIDSTSFSNLNQPMTTKDSISKFSKLTLWLITYYQI